MGDGENGHAWQGGILWARELAGMQFAPVDWLIDGVLPTGLGMLAGKSKIGKSWMVLQIALAVASGRPFAGISTRQACVLYLALEDNARRLQDRINKQLAGQETPETLAMFVEWVNVDNGCLERIQECLDANPDMRLVIIDTFGKVRGRPDGKTSVYQQDYQDMTAFKQLADQRRISILLVHHTRKQDASDALDLVSGSTGIVGAADTIMVLTRKRGASEGKLLVTGRDIKDDVEQAARFSKETGLWELLGPADEITRTDIAHKIRNFLANSKAPMSVTEIADALSQSFHTTRSCLNRNPDAAFEKLSRGLWGIKGRMYAQPHN